MSIRITNNFPSRTDRNTKISELVSGAKKSGIVAGRVIGILEGEGIPKEESGFILKSSSDKIVILSEIFPKAGDIIECKVKKVDGKFLLDGEITVLVSCEDFYIGKSSPNLLRSIVDEKLNWNLRRRSEILKAIREFFEENGFLEVDSPILVKSPGQEPHLDLFKTMFEAVYEGRNINDNLYLITSPEYALKKYLVAGFEKIFQLSHSFRNKESFSDRHNPEFMMLEWYRAYASYLEIMDDTEELVKFLFKKFCEGETLIYKGREINILDKWDRISVEDLFSKFTGREIPKDEDEFFRVFLNEIEPLLGTEKPVIVFDYPISMAALSKCSVANPNFAERFEVYIGGMELCNAFTELNDPAEQIKRLLKEKAMRQKMGKDVYDVDSKFINALKMGMPPSGGNALGVDRLIMLLLNEDKIENILSIPYRDL